MGIADKVITIKAFGHKADGISASAARKGGMTISAMQGSIHTHNGAIQCKSMTTCPDTNEAMALKALKVALEQQGVIFAEEPKKSAISRNAKDSKAPIIMRMTRTLEPSGDTPQWGPMALRIPAGTVILGTKRAPSTDEADMQENKAVGTPNRFTSLVDDDMEEEDEGEKVNGTTTTTTTRHTKDELQYSAAFVWPRHTLEIRMERDRSPGGKILLVLEDLQYRTEAMQRDQAPAQLNMMRLQNEAGAMLAARTREAICEHLRQQQVPEYVVENVGVERRLKGAPVTYIRSSYSNLLSTALVDGQTYSFPVSAVDPSLKLSLTCKIRYDVEDAVTEAKTAMNERAKAHEQQDAATKGRKIKVYGRGVFELSTSALAVQSQIHQGMVNFNAKTGGKQDLWPDGAVTHIEAGKDKKTNERCFFLITSTKAQAEMLIAATDNKLTPPSLLLTFRDNRFMQMHMCRPRAEGRSANNTKERHAPAARTGRRQTSIIKPGSATPKPAAAPLATGEGTAPVPARSSQSGPWGLGGTQAKCDGGTPSKLGHTAAATDLTTQGTEESSNTQTGTAKAQADVLCAELLARIEALEKENKELQRDNKELRALHKKEHKKSGERSNQGQQTLSSADVKILTTTVQDLVMESLSNNSILKAIAGLKSRMEQMEDRHHQQEELARQERLAQQEEARARQEAIDRQNEQARQGALVQGATTATSHMEGSQSSNAESVLRHNDVDSHDSSEAGRKRKHTPPPSPPRKSRGTEPTRGTDGAMMDTEGGDDAPPAHRMSALTQTSLPLTSAGSGGDGNH
jgi:hypothetical protein